MAGAAEVMAAVPRSPGVTLRRAGAQREGRRAGGRGRGRRADAHRVGVRGLQPAQRGHVGGRVAGPGRRRPVRGGRWPADRHRGLVRLRLALRGRHRPGRGGGARAAGPGVRGDVRSPTPTPPAWPRPAGSPSCSTRPARTSGCTSTTPGAPHWSTPTPLCRLGVPRFDTAVGGLGGSPFAGRRRRQPGHRGPGPPVRRPRASPPASTWRRCSPPSGWPRWSVTPYRLGSPRRTPRSRLHPGERRRPGRRPPSRPPSPMPWCETCSRFLNPNTLEPDGSCPTCGRLVAEPADWRRPPSPGPPGTSSCCSRRW